MICRVPTPQNWEFEYYINNRSNSYVRNSVLYIQPTLTADTIGEANVVNGYDMNLWVRAAGRAACCVALARSWHVPAA